jgi:hypothetical protein
MLRVTSCLFAVKKTTAIPVCVSQNPSPERICDPLKESPLEKSILLSPGNTIILE